KRNPDLDKIVYVLEHAESIRATALAQRRLNNLLIVLVGTLLLFAGYLLFVSFEQRRVIKRLEKVASGRVAQEPERKKVFRGDA
ncbi:MAG: hypothetical protein HY042_12135, partial [Spirochaetia bacterium]|nr:hypothetical protein [Spirochaetia bacterium]